jgi:hypothetical protein
MKLKPVNNLKAKKKDFFSIFFSYSSQIYKKQKVKRSVVVAVVVEELVKVVVQSLSNIYIK